MRHDTLIAKVETLSKELATIAGAVQVSRQKGRKAAYMMGSAYIELIGQHMNELVSFFEGEPEKVDEWLERRFAPLAELGEPDWRELVTAIQRGLKQDRYVKEGVRPFLRDAKKDAESAPRRHEPLTVQLAKLRTVVKELRGELKAMTKRASTAETELAQIRKVPQAIIA